MNRTLSSDLIWSWWTQPTAVKQGDNLYFGGVTSNAHWRMFKANSTVSNYILNTAPEPDDHDAPSILAQPGKDVLTFYTRHSQDKIIRYKRAAVGTLAFGSESQITVPLSVAYTQVLSYGDRVLVLFRQGSKWRFVESIDYGDTWGEPTIFLDLSAVTDGAAYLLTQPTNVEGVYHLAVTTRPTNTDWHDIVVGKVDLTNGNFTNFAGIVGNLDGTSLPLTNGDLDSIGCIVSPDRRVRLLDIGTKRGKTYGVYASWGDSFAPRYYYFYQNTDGSFTRVNPTIDAPVFAYSGAANYVGGVALDRNGNDTLYLSGKTGSTWKINQYTITSSMGLSYVDTLSDSSLPLVRPCAPIGCNSVIFHRLDTYNGYKDFQATTFERDRV